MLFGRMGVHRKVKAPIFKPRATDLVAGEFRRRVEDDVLDLTDALLTGRHPVGDHLRQLLALVLRYRAAFGRDSIVGLREHGDHFDLGGRKNKRINAFHGFTCSVVMFFKLSFGQCQHTPKKPNREKMSLVGNISKT